MNIDKLKDGVRVAEATVRRLVKDGASAAKVAQAKEVRREARASLRVATRGAPAAKAPAPIGGGAAGEAQAIEGVTADLAGRKPTRVADYASGDATHGRLLGVLGRLLATHGVEIVLRGIAAAIITSGSGSRAELETAWSVQRLAQEATK